MSSEHSAVEIACILFYVASHICMHVLEIDIIQSIFVPATDVGKEPVVFRCYFLAIAAFVVAVRSSVLVLDRRLMLFNEASFLR